MTITENLNISNNYDYEPNADNNSLDELIKLLENIKIEELIDPNKVNE